MESRKFFLSLLLCLGFYCIQAQKYVCRTAHVYVESTNNLHDVEADNYQVVCSMDMGKGTFNIIALLKSFEFKLGAVNRVFNTRNLDVTQNPRITYNGNITNLDEINMEVPGSYEVNVEGNLYIWDEKRVTPIVGTLTVNDDGTIDGYSSFDIKIEEKNVTKFDDLMRERLPNSLGIDINSLGISRDIHIMAEMNF